MMRFQTTAIVCHYMQKKLKLSGRAMAKVLNVHHRTWYGCFHGTRRPTPALMARMAEMMGMENFNLLVAEAYGRHLRTIKKQCMEK